MSKQMTACHCRWDNDAQKNIHPADPDCETCAGGGRMVDSRSIRAKWSMDGAKTLSQAAKKLRKQADALERMEVQGWQLTGTIDNDWGFCERELPARRSNNEKTNNSRRKPEKCRT